MRQLLNVVFAFFCIVLYAVATVILSVSIILFGGIAWLLPIKSWHHHMMRWVLKFPVWWASVSNALIYLSPNHQWDIRGDGDLSPEKWYLLIANHQTWLDILILGYVFNRKIPILKFFMKKQLLWSLPIAGLACAILGYPFMKRHTRKEIQKHPSFKNEDVETTKKACQKFKLYPTTVMNFLEGSRFSLLKHKRQRSPYLHLLKPKAGGMALVINELGEQLHGIVNVTINYSNPQITFLKFFLGMPCKITVRYERLPITPDIMGDYYHNREFRVYFQRWLNAIWERKDLLLDEIKRHEKP